MAIADQKEDALVTHVSRIQSKVTHMTFVKSKDQRTALHTDLGNHPRLKVTYKLNPESYKVAGHKKLKVAGGTSMASMKAICDTEVNICLMSMKLFNKKNAPVTYADNEYMYFEH